MFGLTPYRRHGEIPRSFVDMDNFFDNFLRDSWFPALAHSFGTMRVDIKETENAYVLVADLPGVPKEELQVEFHEGRLSIHVQHNEQVAAEKENYLCRERRSRSESRTFAFDNVNADEVSAHYKDGVLTVTLPKQETRTKRRRINIA